jgi:RHS repeat-associated protein
MLASSFGDPVIGLDIHFEMVPMPGPVPTPIPNPFTGVIFDPIGLAAGLVISNAIGAVMGAPPQGPVVYWGAFPATNTGTEAKHVPGHILIPPGTAWAPFPKTPKPVVHPGETPKPPNPVKPEDDAVCVFGSKTVSVMGSNAVRLGDVLLSCSEPVRLPSSVVMAVPKGAPIVIGGPPSLDLMAAAFASLRTRFASDSLHALLSRLKPSRFRNLLHRAACFLTGHPVDVATGRMLTSTVDANLPGPLPLRIERCYSSAFASRDGVLGYGWSFSLDQSVWRERGKVVYLAEDGRELEFDTFDCPEHELQPGGMRWYAPDRLMLRCLAAGSWEITFPDGATREFGPIPGRSGRAMIRRIRSRCGYHQIAFEYDNCGCLEWVRDSGGRVIHLEHDRQGRLTALELPSPQGDGRYVHRDYQYNVEGDLVRVTDSQGASWNFEFVSHLMTREQNRTGLSFYFVYDGFGEDAWCVRTWGDGGLYDHTLAYNKAGHATYVTDSRGHTTQYHMNLAGLVVKVVNPVGAETHYEYDSETMRCLSEVSATGREIRSQYDGRGRLVGVAMAGIPPLAAVYDDIDDLPLELVHGDARWTWSYDAVGHITSQETPDGSHYRSAWHQGLLVRAEGPAGGRADIEYDSAKNPVSIRFADGTRTRNWFDNLGRLTKHRDGRGRMTEFLRDTEGRLLQARTAGGVWEMQFDAEGDLQTADSGLRRMAFQYGHFHRLVGLVEAGAAVKYGYDTEGRLTAVTNEAGDRWTKKYDAAGHVVEEQAFDGGIRRSERDRAGRLVRITRPSGRSVEYVYDDGDRPVLIRYSDGAQTLLSYHPDGRLAGAENATSELRLERDPMGRIVHESTDGGAVWVASTFAPGGRSLLESSHGARQAIVRDQLGRVGTIGHGPSSDSHRQESAILRDGAGLEIARRLAGGIHVIWRRDQAGRPVERTITRVVDRRHVTIDARALRWRGMHQVAEIVDAVRGSTEYDHDERGGLIAERRPLGTIDRRLDPAGNVAAPGWRYSNSSRLVATHAATYEYDADGNRIAKIEPRGRWEYVWNAAGMLAEVVRPDQTRVRFAYDGLGRRVRKSVVERRETGDERITADCRFIWDGSRVLHEISGAGRTTTWYWDPGGFAPVAKEQAGRRWAIVTDHLGTPTEMFDEQGEKVWAARLDVLGTITVERGAAGDCPWRWPGQYHDEETGLYHNNFRYYDPETAQYLSQDPLGVLGALRRHGYVSDPVTQIDPYGLDTLIVGGVGGGPGTVTSGQAESPRSPGDVTLNSDPKANPMVHGDIAHVPQLPDESFDRVFFENVGIHSNPPGVTSLGAHISSLDEAHRLLKPDGTLHIKTTPFSPMGAIEQRLKDLGFVDIQILSRTELEAKKPSCP